MNAFAGRGLVRRVLDCATEVHARVGPGLTDDVYETYLAIELTEAGIPDPDFISLDIEGGEAAVLAAFPFMLHRVGFWAIENNSGGPEIATIMRDNGYDLIEFCGPDEIFRRRG